MKEFFKKRRRTTITKSNLFAKWKKDKNSDESPAATSTSSSGSRGRIRRSKSQRDSSRKSKSASPMGEKKKSGYLSDRRLPPMNMKKEMTEKFTTRKDRDTVWIDLPRLSHRMSIIDNRDPKNQRIIINPSSWDSFVVEPYLMDEDTKVEVEEKKEDNISKHSIDEQIADDESEEESCARRWQHWKKMTHVVICLSKLCDEIYETNVTGDLIDKIKETDEFMRRSNKHLINADFPNSLEAIFEHTNLTDSLPLSILCLFTQRIVFEPVFRISREVIKEAKLSDYRGKGSWYIDIIFQKNNRIEVVHRRRGAIKIDPNDQTKWVILDWDIDIIIATNEEDLDKSICTLRKIRLTDLAYNDGVDPLFKRKWTHKLCGGKMILP